jgi:hypothetical protein
MSYKVVTQIMHIRKLGHFNMFDIQREAYELGFFELILFIEEHKKEYLNYILTGN